MENLINLIFPPKCLFCEQVGELFCQNCLSSCDLVEDQVCIVCQGVSMQGKTHQRCRSTGDPTQLLTVYKYKNLIRGCIRFSKYSKKQFMALNTLAFEAIGLMKEQQYDFKDYICVPIPVSIEREKTRGFNQAEKICKVFAYCYDLKTQNSNLIRQKDTKAQHNYKKADRFKNVSGSFRVEGDSLKGKKVLLIDDICTTGATLIEASKELYKAGVKDVRCFTLSRKVL